MNTKRTFVGGAVVVAACLLLPGVAQATAISFGGVGNSASVVCDNCNAQFLDPGVIGSGNSTLIAKNQGALSGLLTANYTSADFPDFNADGLRWTETITNNSGVAWSSYTLTLSTNGMFFGPDSFSPTLASINVTSPNVSYDITKIAPAGSSVTVSGAGKVLTVVFGSAVASGSSFSIHTPLQGLLAAPSSFQITETATAAVTPVPEPASMLLLGVGLVGISARRWLKRGRS